MPGEKIETDKEIIAGILKGGIVRQRYETRLYRRYMDFVRSRPRKYKISNEEAQDAYTEAFLGVINQIVSGNFRQESTIKTFFSRIFRNKCVDQHRKNTTVKITWLDEFPELPDASKDFLRRLMGKEELHQVSQYLNELGERCKEMLSFSGQGYSPGEIAEKMGFKTPRSASSQRYKCLEKLKKLIKGKEISQL